MMKQILVADDDPNILQTIVQYFSHEAQQYEVLYAPNGKIACQIALKNMPDLIIMDWDMPLMSGIEAIRYLRHQTITQATPIIVATGNMLEEIHLAEAFQAGANDYIQKPFSRLEFVARANASIRLAESYQEITRLYEQEKQFKQLIIDQKNRELTTSAIQIARKNQLFQSIIADLEKVKVLSDIPFIIKNIERNLQLDNQWEKFKLHFEEVHPNFFTKIQEKFPELSQYEVKVCAYIKMRLSNKEIAQLLGITLKGVETARYRLRKKIDIDVQENLNEYIQKI